MKGGEGKEYKSAKRVWGEGRSIPISQLVAALSVIVRRSAVDQNAIILHAKKGQTSQRVGNIAFRVKASNGTDLDI